MATTDIISEKPDETITQDINSAYKKEPVVTETETETVQPETVVTPSSTTTKPMFSKNERIGYTLLPLASALLQGKRTGGGSMFNDTLASLGQGLMGTTEVALKIKQLEGANRTKASTTRKQYKLQPSAKKVQIGGQIFTPEMGKIISLDDATLAQYPVDTFVEVTKDSKVTSKSIYVEKPFEIDGVKYEIGQREIPQSVINKQLAISPNVFGDAPDEGKLDSDFRGYAFVDEIFEKEIADGEGKTKTVKDQITDDNAYPIIQEGDQFFVLYKNGEKIPYNQLQGEGRVSSIFTASQYDKARGKIPDAQFFKMEDELEKTKQTILTFNDMFDVIVRGGETFEGKKNSILARVKIFSGQSDKLTDGEKAQLEKEGSLRRLIGQSRLALFGPGVLTEFEQQLAKVALVGNPDFAVIDVVRTLLTRASRSEISKYDLLGKRVQNQRRKRRDPGDKTDTLFDYTTLPLFKEEESIDENDTGGNET